MIFFHTGITVTDIEDAKTFFSEVLGMSVTSERDLSGTYLSNMLGLKTPLTARIAMLRADENSFVELVEYRSANRPIQNPWSSDILFANSPHFAFFVQDLDDFHRRFSGTRLLPLSESVEVIPGGPFAGGLIRFYRSTFGCLFELIQKPS